MHTITRSVWTAWCVLPLLFWCGLIFWLSSKVIEVPLPPFWLKDKCLHFLAFGMVGILAFRATRPTPIPRTKRLFLAVLFATLYGIGDEIHQYFVPGRYFEIGDMVADGVGGLFWAGLYFRLRSLPILKSPWL